MGDRTNLIGKEIEFGIFFAILEYKMNTFYLN
jgi:hypothetical protein